MDRRTVVEFEIHKTRLVTSSFKVCALFDRSEKHLKQNNLQLYLILCQMIQSIVFQMALARFRLKKLKKYVTNMKYMHQRFKLDLLVSNEF